MPRMKTAARAGGSGNGASTFPAHKHRTPDENSREIAAAAGLAGAKAKEGRLEVPAISFRWLYVEIVGDGPLLTNRFGESARKSIEDKQQGKAKQKKPPREPDKEFLEAAYIVGDDGELPRAGITYPADLEGRDDFVWGFRAIAVKKALVIAGGRFADGVMKQLHGMFFLHGPLNGFLPILDAEPVRGDDPVVIGGARPVTTIAYRPYFKGWRIVLPIRYIPNFITRDQVVNLVQLAGQCVSIGSWRVERGGDKGVFHLGKVVDSEGIDFDFGIYKELSSAPRQQAQTKRRGKARTHSR